MVKKRNFMVFRALFCLKYISSQDDILQREALARVLLEERKQHFKIINKFIMAAQKTHNACNKTKKSKFVKTLTFLGSY